MPTPHYLTKFSKQPPEVGQGPESLKELPKFIESVMGRPEFKGQVIPKPLWGPPSEPWFTFPSQSYCMD